MEKWICQKNERIYGKYAQLFNIVRRFEWRLREEEKPTEIRKTETDYQIGMENAMKLLAILCRKQLIKTNAAIH